jgi:hypothetical protein
VTLAGDADRRGAMLVEKVGSLVAETGTRVFAHAFTFNGGGSLHHR